MSMSFSPAEGAAGPRVYDVVIGERIIGTLTASHTPSAGGAAAQLSVIAEIDVPFFGRTIEVFNEFEGDRLFSAKARKVVGAGVREEVETRTRGAGYEVIYRQSGRKRTAGLPVAITFTTLMLYYREPLHVSKVYSERFGQMVPLVRLEEGRYELKLPDGKKTLYTYRNGACVHVQSEVMGTKLVFRPSVRQS